MSWWSEADGSLSRVELLGDDDDDASGVDSSADWGEKNMSDTLDPLKKSADFDFVNVWYVYAFKKKELN